MWKARVRKRLVDGHYEATLLRKGKTWLYLGSFDTCARATEELEDAVFEARQPGEKVVWEIRG